MRNSLRLFFLVAATAAGAGAAAPASVPVAASAPAPASGAASTSDTLTRIESETLVLKARERQLAVRAAILQRENEIAGRQDEGARPAGVAAAASPVVQSLEGIGHNQSATLLFESGAVLDVRAGDVLADGMRVVSIGSHGVTVDTARKKRMRLRMAGSASAPAQVPAPLLTGAAPARPAPGLPPLFPGASGSER